MERVCQLCRDHSEVFVISIIEREDQCEWHRMTRTAGPDCAVMAISLINTHTHTHTGNERSSVDGSRDGDGGEGQDREGWRRGKKCQNPHKSCRHNVENGGGLGGKRKNVTRKSVGSVAADSDNLGNI